MRKLIVLIGALAALGGYAAIAYATADQVDQTFNVAAPPGKANKPIALNVDEETKDKANPTIQPAILKEQDIRFNKGGKFSASAFPRCKKTEIIAKTTCPKGTSIGKGTATAKATLDKIIDVTADLTLWNGEKQNGHDTVYVFAIPSLGPNLLTIGEVSKQPQGPYDYFLQFKIDDIQTLPGATNASVTSVHTQTPVKKAPSKKKKKKGKKKAKPKYLIVGPKTCTGKWVGEGIFKYTETNGSGPFEKTVQGSITCKK